MSKKNKEQKTKKQKKKKRQRIYDLLNIETKPKKMIGVSLWPPSSPELKPLDYNI